MGKRKNAYANVIHKDINYYRKAEKDTQIQYMIDLFSIVLNDPEVMGKDVLGKQRLEKVIRAVGEAYDQYYDALQPSVSPEADYQQAKMDELLKKLFQEKFEPFSARYEYLRDIKY